MTAALRAFIAIRAAEELAAQLLNVAVGWTVYSATRNAMSLACVGLAQFLPNITFVLIAGRAADRYDRRRIARLCFLAQAICLAGLTAWSATAARSTTPVYLLLLLIGTARAFSSPAMSAILPHLGSTDDLPHAVAVSSSVFQVAAIAGPAIGGVLCAAGGPAVFAVAAGLYTAALIAARRLPSHEPGSAHEESLLAGFRYVRTNRILLALISLDLFAVILGGVTALLPIYAREILAAGPVGLGVLRSAPGAGAALVGLFLARRPVATGGGRTMLACVAGFGLATIVFAVSANLWLSLSALAAAGGFDMVSMVIRQTIEQTSTPDAMRGRVSSVSWLFIGASAELGELESGAAAAAFGAIPAALLGGIGTLAVVALWSRFFPELHRA
jgi:MFS family permease